MSLNELNAVRSQPHSESASESLYKKITWKFVPLLFLCYAVAYLDRVNIGFAKLKMLADLGFSDAVYAFGASIFFVGYVVFEIPSNIVLHKIGARIWISRIMITWGIVSAAIAFVDPIAAWTGLGKEMTFYILRFLLGVSEAGFFAGIVLYISYWFPAERQAKVMAGFIVAIPISLVVGGPISGALMDHFHDVHGLAGWQWMLVLEGLPAVILGTVVFMYLDSSVADAKWLSETEKSMIIANLRIDDRHKRHNFSAVIGDYRVWVMACIMVCYSTGIYGLSFWLPTIIKNAGIKSAFDIGLLSAIPWLTSAIAMIANAVHSRKMNERRWHAAVPSFIAGFSFILAALTANNLPVALFFLSVSAAGVMAHAPVFWTFPASVLSGTAAAAGIALITSIGSTSGFVGSYAASLAKDLTGDINNGTYVLAALMLLGGVLVLVIPKQTLSSRLEK